jgi:hypothetical protein
MKRLSEITRIAIEEYRKFAAMQRRTDVQAERLEVWISLIPKDELKHYNKITCKIQVGEERRTDDAIRRIANEEK